jgi:hypothetical protein
MNNKLKMKRLFPLLIILVILAFNESCKEKTSQIDYNPNVNSSSQYIKSEYAFVQYFDIFFMGIHDTNLVNTGVTTIQQCKISWADSTRLELSYADYNHLCDDGLYRRGIYYADFTGDFNSEGGKAVITFDSMLFNIDWKVGGSIELENLGMVAGKYTYSFKVLNGSLSIPDTLNHKFDTFTYNTDYTITWQDGYQTPGIPEDDLLLFQGTANGVTINEESWETTINEPLYNALDCFWIVQGLCDIKVPGANKTDGTIDYLTDDGCNYMVDFYFDQNRFYDELFHPNN